MSAPVALARGLRLERGGREVLCVPELSIGRGESWCLIGPNGAGKTSLLRALGLLDRPAGGELSLFGARLTGAPPLALRRRVVLAFQETLLLGRSVAVNVALPLRLRGVERIAARRQALEALALFGAAHLAERDAHRLSGGEARRVALARAFAPRPELLLLDEPFTALDPPSREALAADLRRAIAAAATTCVAVTHDRDEALALADHVGVVLCGRLVQAGPAESVFRAPATEQVARFVGVENLLPVRVARREPDALLLEAGGVLLRAEGARLEAEAGLACFRAEDVLLGPVADERPGALRCRVEAIEPLRTGLRLRLAGPLPLIAWLSRPAAEALGVRIGSELAALPAPGAVHLIAGG